MTGTREPIAVPGTGYVGLVTAAGFAQLGNEVWCVDVDADKVAALQRGEVPIYEPGLEECLARHRARMHFSTELAPALEHARLLFVAVGTPPTYSGDADLSAVHAVVDAMPASRSHALVMKSTVPVGTGTAIKRVFARQGKADFAYVSCPEFLKEGSALADFLSPDRVVVGDDGDWAGDAVVALYAPLQAPLVRTDIASAEMIKLAANAFLATKISFINEIANVCEETGADVLEVARGMGLDHRIGSHFLRPGVGYGGSCFAGEETVLARHRGQTTLLTFEQLWARVARGQDEREPGLIEPDNLEVLSWVPGAELPQFLPVLCLTRREYDGELVQVQTKMGRRVRTTPDHGWLVGDRHGGEPRFKLAREPTEGDLVPLVLGRGDPWDATTTASLMATVQVAELSPDQLIVRPAPDSLNKLLAGQLRPRQWRVSDHGALAGVPTADFKRVASPGGEQVVVADAAPPGSVIAPTSNPRTELTLGVDFWRVVGLYLAAGATTVDAGGSSRVEWSFGGDLAADLVEEVVSYWRGQGVSARVQGVGNARRVEVSSRLLGCWWTGVLGLGRTTSAARLPDMIWEQADCAKWALLSGLFEGRGSWSVASPHRGVLVELETSSDELADGVLRLLGDLGVTSSQRFGRPANSTQDVRLIRITGAEQVERAIELAPRRDRSFVLASIARQGEPMSPIGLRRGDVGPAWVSVTSVSAAPFTGSVYSLEVVYSHSVVTSGGICTLNCFPKDVSALKQLAGNSGYHFQLLTSVIEVNELQKRRVIGKLQKHLGSLVGKTVALLGLAFKAHTDDMREASSLVLSARLQAAGAQVRAYDPVAETQARSLMVGVEFGDSALEALEGADACVIVTEWPEFSQLEWTRVADRMQGNLVVDGRNCIDPKAVVQAGLTYEGIGR